MNDIIIPIKPMEFVIVWVKYHKLKMNGLLKNGQQLLIRKFIKNKPCLFPQH